MRVILDGMPGEPFEYAVIIARQSNSWLVWEETPQALGVYGDHDFYAFNEPNVKALTPAETELVVLRAGLVELLGADMTTSTARELVNQVGMQLEHGTECEGIAHRHQKLLMELDNLMSRRHHRTFFGKHEELRAELAKDYARLLELDPLPKNSDEINEVG